MEIEKIAEGSFCGVETASNELISTEAEWEALWKKVTSNRTPVPPLPEINFDEKQIIACFIGTQNSGGHTAIIQEVTEEDGKYNVKVVHTKPGADCFVTDVLTQPYFIAAVNKGKSKEASFSLETVAKPCK
ncbi:MAG: protease complex subunit PrcB family protein [Bacteroidia bacterium]